MNVERQKPIDPLRKDCAARFLSLPNAKSALNTAVQIIMRLESSHSFAQKVNIEKSRSFGRIGAIEKYLLSR